MNNVYIVHDGNEYYDFGLAYFNYSNDHGRIVSPSLSSANIWNGNILVDDNVLAKISSMINKAVPQGSKIHTIGKSPYAVADIRKNYQIVRSDDKADYIIVDNELYNNIARGYCTWVLPDIKMVVMTYQYSYYSNAVKLDDIETAIFKELGKVWPQESLENYFTLHSHDFYRISPDYQDAVYSAIGLSGNTAKYSCYKKLDLGNGENPTVDSLVILYNAMKSNEFSANSDEQGRLAFMTFNNLNWRNFPGTVSRLIKTMNDKTRLFRSMERRQSSFPKPVKEFLLMIRNGIKPFKDEADFELYKTYVDKCLDIGEKKVANYQKATDKINRSDIPLEMFQEVYDMRVMIKPKSYEDFIFKK